MYQVKTVKHLKYDQRAQGIHKEFKETRKIIQKQKENINKKDRNYF